jgi:hypothetical protein
VSSSHKPGVIRCFTAVTGLLRAETPRQLQVGTADPLEIGRSRALWRASDATLELATVEPETIEPATVEAAIEAMTIERSADGGAHALDAIL